MKRFLLLALCAANMAYGQGSGIYNPPSKHSLKQLGAIVADTDFVYRIGQGAGNNAALNNSICMGYYSAEEAVSGSSVFIGGGAGSFSVGDYSLFLGTGAGLESHGDGNCFVSFSAGRTSAGSFNTFIGSGAGWGATGDRLLIIDSFINDAEASESIQTNSTFYFDANTAELLLGRPAGTIQIRGANVVTGTIVTNFVQQKNGSGVVTNIILQGVTGTIIKESFGPVLP